MRSAASSVGKSSNGTSSSYSPSLDVSSDNTDWAPPGSDAVDQLHRRLLHFLASFRQFGFTPSTEGGEGISSLF